MTAIFDPSSRRDFVAHVGRLASALAITSGVAPHSAHLNNLAATPQSRDGEWDLSWLDRLSSATDRAVFDWPSIGDPADPIVLEMAERYLDNCAAAYGGRPYHARVVLNIRTTSVPAALSDAAWERYQLGAEYGIKDPVTKQPATRNPFWHRAPDPVPGITLPTLADLMQRDAIVLVCDFALTNMAKRLAAKAGGDVNEMHRSLRGALVPDSFAVPSGIFGLARAQNAGCAYVRV